MARPLISMLREAKEIRSSDMFSDQQKAHALSMLQKEIDSVTGQAALDLQAGGVPPAPQSPSTAAQPPKKPS